MNLRRVAILLAVALVSLGAAAPAPAAGLVPMWGRQLGGSGSDFAQDVTVTAEGRSVVTGSFQGTVDLGGSPLTSTPSWMSDGYLAAYSESTGAHLWSRRFGGTSYDEGRAVASVGGDVVMAGAFQGSTDLGGGPLASAGYTDIAVGAFTLTSGAHVWSRRIGGSADEYVSGVAVAPGGELILAGSFYANGSTDLGGGAVASAGGWDGFVAAYDLPSGTHLWSRAIGGSATDFIQDVAVTPSGEVVVAGYSDGTLDLGGGPLTTAGNHDVFLAAYDAATGAHAWSRMAGGPSTDIPLDLDASGGGQVVVTGYFEGTADLGGGPLQSAGGTDVFVAVYSAGAHVSSRRAGGASYDYGLATAFGPSGATTVAGYVGPGTADLGGGPVTVPVGGSLFLAGYSGANHDWSGTFAGGNAWISSVGTSTSGRPVIGGYFQGSLGLLGQTWRSYGSYDGFLIHFSIDTVAPISTIDDALPVTTTDPLPVGSVQGTVTDDLAGVESIEVTFRSVTSGRVWPVQPTLTCDAPKLACTWSADVPPLPAVYEVTVSARDRGGNAETPGTTATFVVA